MVLVTLFSIRCSLATMRTHGFAQRRLAFSAPILAVEVNEYGSVGNCQLGLENEDVVLCAILRKFVDQRLVEARVNAVIMQE
jgi:hypothetical protein